MKSDKQFLDEIYSKTKTIKKEDFAYEIDQKKQENRQPNVTNIMQIKRFAPILVASVIAFCVILPQSNIFGLGGKSMLNEPAVTTMRISETLTMDELIKDSMVICTVTENDNELSVVDILEGGEIHTKEWFYALDHLQIEDNDRIVFLGHNENGYNVIGNFEIHNEDGTEFFMDFEGNTIEIDKLLEENNEMKKFLALACVLVMGLAVMVGCGSKGDEKEELKTPALADINTAIAGAYDAEMYMPTAEMPDEFFSNEFPISADLIAEKMATSPMIGMHPDRVVLIKATEGKGEEVEKELIAIRDKKISEFMDYPQNLAKTQAAEVVRKGDYVAFLLVGAINEDMDASEEDALAFAKDEVKKAVDAFNAQF